MTEQKPFAFADDKDPQAFRTIGEVAQALGIKQHVLRYWEEQFPTLKPLKRSGGRRYYRPEDVALVAQINHLLYSEGFTIRGAKQALGGKSARNPPSAEFEERPGEETLRPIDAALSNDVAARLQVLRENLAQALHGD